MAIPLILELKLEWNICPTQPVFSLCWSAYKGESPAEKRYQPWDFWGVKRLFALNRVIHRPNVPTYKAGCVTSKLRLLIDGAIELSNQRTTLWKYMHPQTRRRGKKSLWKFWQGHKPCHHVESGDLETPSEQDHTLKCWHWGILGARENKKQNWQLPGYKLRME